MSLRATYIYTDEQGRPIFRKRRFEPGSRGRSKTFSIEAARYTNRRLYWIPGEGVLDKWQPEWKAKALYNLPLVLDALAHREPVFICEGEKDSDCLVTMHKVAATTNWQGAKRFTLEQADWLAQRKSPVHIVMDNDDAGFFAGWQRYQVLRTAGARKSRLHLWLPAGGAKDVTERVALVGTSRSALESVSPRAVEGRAAAVEAESAASDYWGASP